jgi:hypothetical protein
MTGSGAYCGRSASTRAHSSGWPDRRNLLSSERPLSDEERDVLQEVAGFAAANPDDPHIAQ